jgi:hypothetical protein
MRLRELAPESLSTPLRERLDEALTAAHLRAMGFLAATERVAGSLEEAGIRAVALKGPTLAAEVHGDPALRDYSDIDVLIDRERLERASTITAGLGWTEADEDSGLPRLHRVLRDPGGALPPVELHWRVHWYETHFGASMLDRSEWVDGARRLQPLDTLAALLLFYARDGLAGLRLPADIAGWWDRHGSPEVAAGISRLIAEHSALAEAWRAALYTAVRVAGLPADLLTAARRPHSRRGVLATRLANWDLRGDVDQINANVSLIDGLLAPPRGLPAFIGRQLLDPPAGDEPCLQRAAVHVAKTLTRYALALGALRRHRWWSPPIAARHP